MVARQHDTSGKPKKSTGPVTIQLDDLGAKPESFFDNFTLIPENALPNID
jgi:hypothetical protein